MSAPTSVPVLIFDGDCGFCTTCARFLARWVSDGRSTLIAPWQRLNLADLDLTADQCRAAVQWVGEGGQAASGHRAIAAALRAGHPVWRPVGALLVAPGFSWLAERIYSWIASHRFALPGGTPACRVEDPNLPR
ncbi:MAG TPA: DCC1-like thiol-disulfide oxidoreductase family protein [Dermatophilaceae bacterium]|jgi:predicted DCC family thiol-disulfide oxidoreductase YuxK|nr:DCC1-like thiol-disulfide oxidoreductase family protein [Dermatophilaceae bacterium]